MMKRYSIAEARNNFTSLVHAAEAGARVELTRRGKPIAVLLALSEYQRLSDKRSGFTEIYQDFLRRNPEFADNAVEPEEWLRDIRDSTPGRDFTW
jgi:prevent-host-death family protein